MTISRRQAMRLGQVLLTGAMVSGKAFGATPPISGPADPHRPIALSREGFSALVNASFAVHRDATARDWFTLLSVKDTSPKPSPSSLALDTFLLQFSSSGEALSQGTYVFENSSVGQLPLFIVPSGPSTYTAVISRFANSAPQHAAR